MRINDPTPTLRGGPAREVRDGSAAIRSPWVWMILASALLGASGGARAWQDSRFGAALKQSDVPPFPLKELPYELGCWKARQGSETRLDPEIARIAGCSDHLIRTYTDQTTGVSLVLLVLFGRSSEVAMHTPQVCYPSAGYAPVEAPMVRPIPGLTALFRSEVFAKGVGGREEVHHSFLFNHQWIPEASGAWKQFRHHPSMFKVQVQRHVAENERRGVNNPTEEFLKVLLPEIEGRLSSTQTGQDG
jgi:hypothetical protein